MEKPKQLETVDLTELREICQEYIDYHAEDNKDFHEDGAGDFEHYIMETAVSTIFGEDVWDFINAKEQED